MRSLERMWINQPSTLQPMHKLHGTNVLYDAHEERIYFLSGPVVSSQVMPIVLSRGWLNNSRSDTVQKIA